MFCCADKSGSRLVSASAWHSPRFSRSFVASIQQKPRQRAADRVVSPQRAAAPTLPPAVRKRPARIDHHVTQQQRNTEFSFLHCEFAPPASGQDRAVSPSSTSSSRDSCDFLPQNSSATGRSFYVERWRLGQKTTAAALAPHLDDEPPQPGFPALPRRSVLAALPQPLGFGILARPVAGRRFAGTHVVPGEQRATRLRPD